jgi:hypothetical protein
LNVLIIYWSYDPVSLVAYYQQKVGFTPTASLAV